MLGILGGVPSLLERLGPVRAFRELRRDFSGVVFVLAAGDLVASFGFSLVFPFLTIYLVEALGATASEAGLVIAGYAVCSIVSGAVGGWLADRVGRKAVMIVSVGVTGLVVVLMGQARDLVQIAALTVALGLIDPAFVPAARAAIADVVEEPKRPRAYGLLGVAAAVGWIAGPSIGAGLATLGYPVLFTIAGVIISAYALIALIWLPETRPTDLSTAVAHGAAAGFEGGPPIGAPLEVEHCGPDCTRLHRHRYTDASGRRPVDARLVFVAFLPIAAVVHAAAFQWVTSLPIYARADLGVPTATWGLLFSINGILIVLFQLRVSTIAERYTKPRLMAASSLLYGAGMLIVAVVTDPRVAVAALAATIVLVTIGEMLLYPIEPSFVSDLSPVTQRGRYQGIAAAATGVGSAVGPPLGGYLLDTFPGPLAWQATAGALLVAAVAFLALGRLSDRLPTPGGDRNEVVVA